MNEQPGGEWTTDRVTLLKALWKDGLSAGQIAVELGHVTRNGVIGKVHRLGLDKRMSPAPRAAPGFTPPSRPAPRPAVPKVAGAPQPAPEPEPPAVDDIVIPPEQRRTLLELENDTCRWPVGLPDRPDFFFCGARSNNLVDPYCQHHQRIAYNGVPDRRRGRPGAFRYT